MVTKINTDKSVNKSSKRDIADNNSKSLLEIEKKNVSSTKSSIQVMGNKAPKHNAGNSSSETEHNKGLTITLKQVISGDGRGKKQIGTLKGLGLNKINKVSTLQDTVAIRGMINKVSHLIKIISEGKDNVK